MRIGIDARLFGPKTGGGGLGRYAEELVRNLEKIDRENEYVIFLRRENWNEYEPSAPNFKKSLAPWRWYTLSEQIFMPRAIRQAKVELMHFPHFNVPVFGRTAFVVTIHDLNLLEYPKTGITNLDPIRFWLKFLGYRLVLRHALKQARAVIAVSKATRDSILRRFPFCSNKISVIPLGYKIDAARREPNPSPLSSKSCILAVGNAYPHKNLQGLLKAFRQISDELTELKIVLVGPNDRFKNRLREQAAKLGLADRIIFHGFADEAELDGLYKNALALIMPSFLEGFGFPILEAQSRNIPVLASDIPALRETAADSALFFNPHNTKSIADAIKKIASEENLRQSLIRKGAENIKRFNWAETASRTLAIYRFSGKI